MDSIQWMLFLIIGGIGGFIGNKLRFPAGTLMGAMLAVGICKYFGLISLISSNTLSFLVQLGLGLTLGIPIASLDMEEFKKLSKVLIIVGGAVFIMTFVTGYLLSFLTKLGLRTVFLSAAPGGLAEMAIIAKSVELNSSVVAVLHIIRLIIVMTIFPLIIKHVKVRIDRKKNELNVSNSGRSNTHEL
jgi:uncharacterized protein